VRQSKQRLRRSAPFLTRSDSSATELTRIRLDDSNDDQTFVIARIVKIRHK
jgi:hypothetical protein